MANLITEKQIKYIQIEYIVRLVAMIFLLVSLLGVIFLAYVIPYYILVKKNDLIVSDQFKSALSAENRESASESSTWLVTRTLDQMKIADLYHKNAMVPSDYFAKILSSRNAGIKITKLSFSLVKPGQGQILASGIAKSRGDLVSFVESLKTNAGFSSVESPISDLAKESGITFTVNIKVSI